MPRQVARRKVRNLRRQSESEARLCLRILIALPYGKSSLSPLRLGLVSPRGICGGQRCTGTDFLEFFGFPCQCHSTVALHAHISPGA
jgi:hypothetical protein